MKNFLLKSGTILTFTCIANINMAQNSTITFNWFDNNVPEQTQSNSDINNRNPIQLQVQVQVQQIQSNLSNGLGPNENTKNLNFSNISNSNVPKVGNYIQTNNRFTRIRSTYNNSKPKQPSKPTSSPSRNNIVVQTSNRGGNYAETISAPSNNSNRDRNISIELPKITAPKIITSTSPKPEKTKETETSGTVEKTDKASSQKSKDFHSSWNKAKNSKKVKQHKFKKKITQPTSRWMKRTFKKKSKKSTFSVKCFSFRN